MNRILNEGDSIFVPGKANGCFVIKKILGVGASSVTYLAECNKTEHVLKECNPLSVNMYRDDNGKLIPDTDYDRSVFEEYLLRFEDGASKQVTFRSSENLKNPTSNVQERFCANGTSYIDMTFFTGETYDQVESESLFDLFKRMKALTKVIGNYHKDGYLHLDIKPQNIYTIPETPEFVIMFDFDSVVAEVDVKAGIALTCTEEWAAPEQKVARYRKDIGKATDLYAIGEMIFYRIMGRHSTLDDRYDFSEYEYNKNAEIFKNINPKIFGLLDELFHRTLCCVPRNRFQLADELIVLLNKIIPLANPNEHYFIGNLPVPKDFFVGRNSEIEEIHMRLQQNPILFLHGIGGIGKSELAKQYAKKYENEYETIVWAPYVTDIISVITNDRSIQINNYTLPENKKVEEYYDDKLCKIKELISANNNRILLIVDNLDSDKDINIKDLFDLDCDVLITSRLNMMQVFNRPQMEIGAIDDLSLSRLLFAKYYDFDDCESDDVDAIIDLVQSHTLAIELIAKQVYAEQSTVKEIREKLERGGMCSIGGAHIDSAKDDVPLQDNALGHIKALFDLSIFESNNKDNELYVLSNLSLVPFTGIGYNLFADWCDLDHHGGKTCVNNLIKGGWISKTNDLIFLHPIVSDVASLYAKNHTLGVDNMLNIIHDFVDSEKYTSMNVSDRRIVCELLKDISIKLLNSDIKTDSIKDYLNYIPTLYSNFGYWMIAKECLIKSCEIAMELNNDCSAECINLSSFYIEIRDWLNFKKCMQKVFTKFCRSRKKDSFTLGILYYNTGITYLRMFEQIPDQIPSGMYRRATRFLKMALLLFKYDTNGNPVTENIIDTYVLLGSICSMRGRTKKAIKYYQKATSFLLASEDISDESRARFYCNLGTFYTDIDNQKALCYFNDSVSILHSAFGMNDSSVASAYFYRGQHYYFCRDYGSAEKDFLKALEILKKVYIDVHPELLKVYSALANLYEEIGNDIKKKEYEMLYKDTSNVLNMK